MFFRYKIENSDLNNTWSTDYIIKFNINRIKYGRRDLLITLFRSRGYNTTITVDSIQFEPILSESDNIVPHWLTTNFIFNERNDPSISTIYLKNRYGDLFLYAAIISLAFGITFPIYSIGLNKQESEETKKRLGEIERKMSKKDEIKAINEKLDNIDKKINKILKDR